MQIPRAQKMFPKLLAELQYKVKIIILYTERSKWNKKQILLLEIIQKVI